jgi:hypothetical protein
MENAFLNDLSNSTKSFSKPPAAGSSRNMTAEAGYERLAQAARLGRQPALSAWVM